MNEATGGRLGGPAGFAVETLRGIGQVDLQARLLTGALVTIALFTAGWRPGVFGLLGAAASTATAMALGVDRRRIRFGLEGYCGALTGIAAVTYLGTHPSSWLVAIAGAAACTVITATMSATLGVWALPALTGPFCVVGSAIVIGAPSFARIWHGGPAAAASSPVAGAAALTFGHFVKSLLTNVSEVFLLNSWWAGAIILVALAFSGRKVVLAALAGSLVGTLTAWALGAPASGITEGIYGYNAVLVMIALGATFLEPTAANVAYALLAAVFCTILTAAMANIFDVVGGHTLTWPFNLTAWAFLAAAPAFTVITTSRPREEGATP